MKWFNDLRLGWKLLGAYSLMSLMLAFVGWQGLSTAQGLNSSLDRVSNETVPTYKALSKTKDATVRGQRDILYVLVEHEAEQKATFLTSVQTDIQTAADQFAAYKAMPMSEEEKPQVAQFETSYAVWAAAIREAVAAAASDKAAGTTVASDIVIQKAKPRYSEMAVALNNLMTIQEQESTRAAQEGAAKFDRALKTLLGVVGAGLVFAVGFGVFLSRNLSVPMGFINDLAQRAARGETDYDIGDAKRRKLQRKDEVGMIGNAMADLRAYVSHMASVADSVARGDLTVNVRPYSELDVLGNAFVRMISGLRELVGEVQGTASTLADTSAQLGIASSQTGAAVSQVSQAVQNVAAGASDTCKGAQTTNDAVDQLTHAIEGIAGGAAEQARQVRAVSTTATQMATGVEHVAASAQSVAQATELTRTAAEQGSQAVDETTAAMTEIETVVGQAANKVRDLGSLGDRIGAVVETIDDIAEQTNLLALNAAIEAARAGEHGRGFAVVADEVRKLAERSSRETKQIAELIQQVQGGTRDAVGAMESGSAKVAHGSRKAAQAGQALEEILRAVEATVGQVNEIAVSSREMAANARSVTDAMRSISVVVEENTAATEEMAAQADDVKGSIQGIAAVSEEQSAATEEVSASAEEMSAQIEEMSAHAQELAETAAQLRNLVARFRLDEAQQTDECTNIVQLRRAA
jgi:methyl-accepting chemotaxis protein